MSILNNGLSRFLISGFGLGMPAARAVGITIFVCLTILDKRDGMCNVHAIRKYGVELRVSFVGYTSTFMPEQCGFHAFF